jgi:soluble lytic murein transglycosylase
MRAPLFCLLCLTAPAATAPAAAAPAEAIRVGDAPAARALVDALPEGVVRRVLRARVALLEGNAAAADAALESLQDPDLADVLALLRLRVAVRAGADPRTAADALLALPDLAPALRSEARLRRAVATLDAKTLGTLGAQRGPYAPPALAAASGDPAALLRLQMDFGETAEARRLPVPALSRAQRRTRAGNLFKARAYDLVQPALRGLFSHPKTRAVDRQWARITLATVLMRLRERPEEALALLSRALKGPDRALKASATYRRGLVLGRLRKWDRAISDMRRYTKRWPRGTYRHSASYQVGRLLQQAGRFKKAARAHEKFLRRRRPDPPKYVWFHGWSLYRAGDFKGARAIWAPLRGKSNLLVGPKATYWTARCFTEEGRPAQALEALDALRAAAPLSYYGMQGAALRARLDAAPLVLPPRPHGAPLTLAGLEDLSGAPRRLRLLVETGFPQLARQVKTASKGPPPVVALEGWGEVFRRLPRTVRRLPWQDDLAGRPRAEVEGALPPAYLALARAAGRPHNVSPWWLLPHMLQESRFKERAVSHAGAMGPMQVLPRTGRLIAQRLRFPSGDFLGSQLYAPGVALRHAAWYLAALREEYGGSLLLAAAAYNGGPRRLSAHLAATAGLPLDVVIEEIGAHEMRNYVRKIADHIVRYSSLYADDAEREALLRAVIAGGPTPRPKGGIDF